MILQVEQGNDFINLKLSAAGVMPIIFAQAIMFLPLTAAQWAAGDGGTQVIYY